MSNATRKLLGTTPAAGGQIDISDYFSTYLYTGNGSTQTITNGIDLAGEGGMVWIKSRSDAVNNVIVDTERVSGTTDNYLMTNLTNAQVAHQNEFGDFTSTGFTVPYNTEAGYTNFGTRTYASWTWRKAPRFFDCFTFTGDGVNGRVLNHNLGVEPGMVVVKSTSLSGADTGTWRTYHRGYGFGGGLSLERTDSAGYTFASPITAATDTTITLNNPASYGNINSSGATYVAYLFAHDPLGPSGDGSDGLIACGSVPANAETTENLGWEPQWLLIKRTDSTGDWQLFDNMRGFFVGGPDNARLRPNLSNAEDGSSSTFLQPRPTGFYINTNYFGGGPYIYIAIRRGPMRQPTSGTEVYSAGVVQNNTGRTLTNPLGYPSDMAFTQTSAGGDWIWQSRLTGKGGLFSNKTNAESTFYGYGFGNNTNYEADGTAAIGAYGWNFRRAPGFFDAVAYSGSTSNQNINHSLGVVPELIIIKVRNGTNSWPIYNKDSGVSNVLYLNQTWGNGSTTRWNSTAPTATQFTLQGSNSGSNTSGENYIAYLFATLSGVSKVGSYTGTGFSNIDINCGFTSGARFVLIKRTDSTGNWWVVDVERGIVSGNEPLLALDSTSAEITGYNMVEPLASGFTVNGGAGKDNSWNDAGGTYIYLAIA